MAFSITGFGIAWIMYLILSIVAFGLAYYASTLLGTTPTVAINATIAANNKTAASLIQAGAWVSLLPLLLIIILGLIMFFSSMTTPFSSWYYLLYIIIFIAWIASIILIWFGISYIDSSTANTNSSSARTYAIIAAILLAICIFPVLYMVYSTFRYNTVPVNDSIELVTVTTNESYPGTILEQEITVNSLVQDKQTSIVRDGQVIVSNTKPEIRKHKDVFVYNKGAIGKKEDIKDVKQNIIKADNGKYYVKKSDGTLVEYKGLDRQERNAKDLIKINNKYYYQLPDGSYEPYTGNIINEKDVMYNNNRRRYNL